MEEEVTPILGGVAVAFGVGGIMALTQNAGGVLVDSARGLDEKHGDAIALGDAVGVVPRGRLDAPTAGGVVERAVARGATRTTAKHPVADDFGSAAEGDDVAAFFSTTVRWSAPLLADDCVAAEICVYTNNNFVIEKL